jgi:hypothetical protein
VAISCECRNELSGSIKMQGIYGLAEELPAFQEWLQGLSLLFHFCLCMCGCDLGLGVSILAEQ